MFVPLGARRFLDFSSFFSLEMLCSQFKPRAAPAVRRFAIGPRWDSIFQPFFSYMAVPPPFWMSHDDRSAETVLFAKCDVSFLAIFSVFAGFLELSLFFLQERTIVGDSFFEYFNSQSIPGPHRDPYDRKGTGH